MDRDLTLLPLTLREFYTGIAMHALIISQNYVAFKSTDELAEKAVQQADSILEALTTEEPPIEGNIDASSAECRHT